MFLARALVTHARVPHLGWRRVRGRWVPKVTTRSCVSKRPRAVANDASWPPDVDGSPENSCPTPRSGDGGCFVDHCFAGDAVVEPVEETRGSPKPLAGVTFGVKDNLDVKGCRTGAGSPLWLETKGLYPAKKHAKVVELLLNNGAIFTGKTQMDELAWALQGENYHYGTPINPVSVDTIPGGSSSGSAVAVAAGYCSVALGTDTAGSVRVPAAYCGMFGFRPSHGAISMEGCVPLAPSFDTIGWFANDSKTLENVGHALLPEENTPAQFTRVFIAKDAFQACDAKTVECLSSGIKKFGGRNTLFAGVNVDEINLGGDESGNGINPIPSAPPLTEWWDSFRILQTKEVWAELGGWIEDSNALSSFGPGVLDRFQAAYDAHSTQSESYNQETETKTLAAAAAVRSAASSRINALLSDGTIIILPTAPGPAISKTSAADEVLQFRMKQLRLTCASGFAGTPQVQIPDGFVNDKPVGVSLMGPVGSDRALLRLVRELTQM